ncbi:serine/threonine-protein kinase [Sulfidibacter corallicola]|uniref:Serine/threonine protein kinase n=1 Tax=Sulfidibacter corallicola TaxID=2818388 RepID=A0A8A4TV88_SULCO|nr:serine/threonine-protein kinase [Sulfidibacter corallicola]QTD53044.1 serine/threonine protein kinase [Sulfidibacter corallicola]
MQPGELVGQYQIWKFLGKGAMGRVYQAFDKNLNRWVALKILSSAADPERTHKMMVEARNQATVDHENICKVYETGEFRGLPYIVMQYIDGVTLDKAHRFTPLREKVLIIQKIAEGLHKAHECGLIHRDIKPQNVMIERGKIAQVYLMDFGVAKQKTAPSNTVEGEVKGSPAYMSPEQAEGRVDLDHRSDIYNLGATLYFLLAGRAPYSGENTVEILLDVMEQEPDPIRKIAPDLPQDLQNITMKCIQRSPELRYQSALALANDLRRYLADEPVSATPATPAYLVYKFIQKHKYPVMATVLVLLSLVAGLVGTTMAMLRADQAREAAALSAAQVREESDKAMALLNFVEDLMRESGIDSSSRKEADLLLADAISSRGQTFRQISVRIDREFERQPEIQAMLYVILGRKRLATGHARDAAVYLERGSEVMARTFGPLHPRVLQARFDLAHALARDFQMGPAGEVSRGLLEECRVVLGEADHLTIAVRDLWIFLRFKQIRDAHPQWDRLAKKVLAGAAKPDFPGFVCGEMEAGRFVAARDRYQALADGGSADEPPLHDEFFREILCNRIAFQGLSGNLEKVSKDFDLLGTDRGDGPSTTHLSLLLWRAEVQAQLGRFDVALNGLAEVERAANTASPLDEILKVRAAGQRARIMMQTRRVEEADAHLVATLADLAEPSSALAYERNWLVFLRGQCALQLGNATQADGFLHEALTRHNQFGGFYLVRSLYLHAGWAEWLRAEQRFEESANLLEQLIQASARRYGPRHWFPARLNYLRAQVYLDQDQPLAAEPLLISAADALLEELGPKHPYTRQAAQLLMSLFETTGRVQMKERLQERLNNAGI